MAINSQTESWKSIRYVFIAILVLILTIIFLVWRIDNSRIERFRLAVMNATIPNITFLLNPIRVAGQMVNDFQSYAKVYNQNRQLKIELQGMRGWREAALQLEQQNSRLRALNKVKLSQSLTWITGEIIADISSPFSQSCLINRGLIDGVDDGAAVVDGLGLIGRVSGVEKNISRIVFASDVSSFIPAVIETTNQQAVVRGDNSLAPTLEFIKGATEFPIGSRVLTSGKGGLFPSGILIGKIIIGPKKNIRVQLSANFNEVDYLRILRFENITPPTTPGKIMTAPHEGKQSKRN